MPNWDSFGGGRDLGLKIILFNEVKGKKRSKIGVKIEGGQN